jgi:hypothetical protein
MGISLLAPPMVLFWEKPAPPAVGERHKVRVQGSPPLPCRRGLEAA